MKNWKYIHMHKMATVVCLAIFAFFAFTACSTNNTSQKNDDFNNATEFIATEKEVPRKHQDQNKYSEKYESFNPDATISNSFNLPPNSSGGMFSHTWKLTGVITDCLEDGDIAKVRIERGSNDYYFPYVKDDVYVDLRRLDMWVNQDEVGKSVAFSIRPWIGEGVAFPTKWEILD